MELQVHEGFSVSFYEAFLGCQADKQAWGTMITSGAKVAQTGLGSLHKIAIWPGRD